MYMRMFWTIVAAVCFAVVLPEVLAQGETGPVVVAVGSGSSGADIEAADARIAQMVAAGELVLRSTVADRLSAARRHEYYVQVHEGVPVLGGGVSRQVQGDRTVSVFGTVHAGIDVAVQPSLSVSGAMDALARVSSSQVSARGGPSLVVLPRPDGTYRLTYEATHTDGEIRFVDAATGALVETRPAYSTQTAVGTGQGVHGDTKKISATRAGTSFEARDGLRPAEIVTQSTQGLPLTFGGLLAGNSAVAADTDNDWTNGAVVDAHVFAGWTYDYFYDRFGWQGLDGQNARIVQLVADVDSLPNNAFFAPPPASGPEGGVVVYGESTRGVPYTPLDIVAHELMHGVTYFSVRARTGRGLGSAIVSDGLGPVVATYQGQGLSCNGAFIQFADGTVAPFVCVDGRYAMASNHGGAVNEAVSDVFGAAVEFFHQPPGSEPLRSDYLLGEDLTPPGLTTQTPIRVLDTPSSRRITRGSGGVTYPDHFNRRIRFPMLSYQGRLVITSWSIIDDAFVLMPSTDAGAVHWNSTILGHVYYLAVEGGRHASSGVVVPGVGAANREQIDQVFFRAMSDLMPSTTTFQLSASVLRQAAVDLYGSNSAPYRAVDGALDAVGL